ncbi:MAG: hypothetical protein AB4352_27785 [Hormoscilla sp.]
MNNIERSHVFVYRIYWAIASVVGARHQKIHTLPENYLMPCPGG